MVIGCKDKPRRYTKELTDEDKCMIEVIESYSSTHIDNKTKQINNNASKSISEQAKATKRKTQTIKPHLKTK